MSTISSTLPDYRFVAESGLFPGIPDREIANEQVQVNGLNATESGLFQRACNQWLSDATLARNAKQPLPTKPISPASWVVVTADGMQNGATGKYIARSQVGPVYGVCPDLPPIGSGSSGTIVTGPVQIVTQDQKLDSIMAALTDLSDRLKKAGV